MHVIAASKAKASALRGYRSIGDVTFDLNRTLLSEIGWVVFEVDDDQSGCGRGVIGTFNNYMTLTLIRFARAQKPCCMYGVFDDGETGESTWILDDVGFTGMLVRDASGLIGFRASTMNRTD